jgi:hypothetical protein
VPESLRAGCLGLPVTAPLLAIAGCTSADFGLLVNYQLYQDQAATQAAYDTLVALSQIEPGTGTCARPESWPAEGGYSVGGAAPGGRLLCMLTAGVPTLYWTSDAVPMLAIASRPDSDYDQLWQFWLTDSGPE